jgi:ATP-binding cassette subfamily F protein 3
MVISHDRYFLDKVTNRTLEVAFGRLDGDYPAGYNKYLELKAAKLELLLKQYKSQQAEVAKTEEFIRRFKSGQRSKEARGRERRLNRLKEGWEDGSGRVHKLIEKPDQQRKLALNINTQVRSGERALRLDKLVVGYGRPQDNGNGSTGSKVLIKCPDLEIMRGQRVALMGPNGSGKTTLLRTLVGELEPLRGAGRLGHNVVMNYYAQSHEGLNMQATIIDEIRRVSPGIKETPVRTLLGRFLFSGDDVYKHVGDLSGGERSRVALAQLTLMGGNLLVLDEPTNHLDIDAREALEGVLNEYQGTILFVSHDRYFIDAVADTLWVVEDGTITPFDGNYSEWAAMREGDRRPSADDRRSPADDRRPTSSNGHQPANNGQQSGTSAPQSKEQQREERKKQRRLAALEDEIAALEAELKQLEQTMTDASTKGDAKKVTHLSVQYAEKQETLQTRYDEWAAVGG